MARVKATGFKALQSFVRTLTNWLESILNYFDGRHSNGFAEGVNLKVKMINRRGFGYRNFQHFRLHVLVAFEPVSRLSRKSHKCLWRPWKRICSRSGVENRRRRRSIGKTRKASWRKSLKGTSKTSL